MSRINKFFLVCIFAQTLMLISDAVQMRRLRRSVIESQNLAFRAIAVAHAYQVYSTVDALTNEDNLKILNQIRLNERDGFGL